MNYFFDLMMKDMKRKGAERIFDMKSAFDDLNFTEIKTKMENINFDTIFETGSKMKKTATTDGVYSYRIEVPGFSKDMLDINLEKGMLTIKGKNGEKTIAHSIEIGEDTINKVTLDLGILEIKINEIKPKEKSTKINID